MIVHSGGAYHHNTALKILENEFNYKTLHMVHRLDKLTSGVLIFAKGNRILKIIIR